MKITDDMLTEMEPIVSQWIRERGTCMDGASYAAALELAAYVAARRTTPDREAWISVDERMPEPDEPVLAYNGKWMGVAAWMSGEYLEPIERWQDERREFIELLGPAITHWMPLPTAPGHAPVASSRDTLIEEIAEMVDHMGEGRRLEEYVGAIREMRAAPH